VEDAGLVFIGPAAEAVEAMGDKTRRGAHDDAGVPVVPGTTEPLSRRRPRRGASRRDRLPGAAEGGGGRGREGDAGRAASEAS
jgi:acetyl/propionyl-CoA carboxylase alpha subunit